jgi:hypothetical protein
MATVRWGNGTINQGARVAVLDRSFGPMGRPIDGWKHVERIERNLARVQDRKNDDLYGTARESYRRGQAYLTAINEHILAGKPLG